MLPQSRTSIAAFHMMTTESRVDMQNAVTPDRLSRRLIEAAVRADMYNCWTCSSCDLECPVNIATGRLRPQKIIRLANFGLKNQLVTLPEIWYCLTCRRCSTVCPNQVKPADIIAYFRNAAVKCKIVSDDALRRYRDLFTGFQNIRWHAAAECLLGRLPDISEENWHYWLEKPLPDSADTIRYQDLFHGSDRFRHSVGSANTGACFTCSECSNICPVMCPGGVFDPRWIFRMANLGLTEALLKSPSIWLCLDCRRCTDTCSQLVRGHDLIRGLQSLALKEGFVDTGFALRWYNAQKILYPLFLKEVDRICIPSGSDRPRIKSAV